MSDLLVKNLDVLKELFTEILTLKNDPNSSKNNIDEATRKATLSFVMLKKVNRMVKFKLRTGREELQAQKALVDGKRLQLQNLLYEASYLKREIRLCYQFKSQDEDIDIYESDTNLVDESELTHQQRIERLERELNLRKQLSNECNKLLKSKAEVSNDIVVMAERLSKFAPSLNVLLAATKPLQDNLQLSLEQTWKIENKVNLLPLNLYLAYVNLKVPQINDDHFSVNIQGVEDEIKAYNIRRSKADVLDLTKETFLQPYPLFLQIMITHGDFEGDKLTINIFQFPSLGIVTANCNIELTGHAISIPERNSIQDFLKFICENDSGACMPYAETEVKIQNRNITVAECFEYFAENKLGKPYRWVQQMCGGPPTHDIFNNINAKNCKIKAFSFEIIKRMKQYWHSGLYLLDQIQAFMNKKNLDAYMDDNALKYKPKCNLVQWSSMTWEEYASNDITLRYREENLVDEDGFFYRAVLVFNSAKMDCLISVSAKYPRNAPFWIITIDWNGHRNSFNNASVKAMEYWTNCLRDNKSGKYIMAAQLLRTMYSFDIYLETESPSYQPLEYIKEKNYVKAFATRTRARPYKRVIRDNLYYFKQ